MPHDLNRLHRDIAQIQHDDAGFGTGRLVAENLILTAAHTLWNLEKDTGPVLDGWQVRLARDRGVAGVWPFRRGNKVVWYDREFDPRHDRGLDLALIELVDPEGGPLRPELRLRIATVSRSNPHSVEARGYPRASKQADGPRELTPALGRLTAGEQDRPLRFGVDSCDLPNEPHADWPGMSGSAVYLREGKDESEIWVYGVVRAVQQNFNGQLTVARLADAWRDTMFRSRLTASGALDEDAEDPSPDEIGYASASIRLLPHLVHEIPAAAEARSRSKEAIENTYRQVDRLDLLKTVHDALHTVEFEVLRPMEEEAGSRVRPSFAVRFAGQRRKIQDGVRERGMPGALRDELMDRLKSAGETFQAAVDTPNQAAHARVCGELNGLLSFVSPALDTAISMTAAELSLDRLVALMSTVRVELPAVTSDQDRERQRDIHDFGSGIDELARLHSKLTQHVHEHGQLQRLDLRLRSLCASGTVPGLLAKEWERVKRVRSGLSTPHSPAVDEANGLLIQQEAFIEAALEGEDETAALDLLREYFRSVSSVFRDVDGSFKEFTLGLTRLRPSLKQVLDSL